MLRTEICDCESESAVVSEFCADFRTRSNTSYVNHQDKFYVRYNADFKLADSTIARYGTDGFTVRNGVPGPSETQPHLAEADYIRKYLFPITMDGKPAMVYRLHYLQWLYDDIVEHENNFYVRSHIPFSLPDGNEAVVLCDGTISVTEEFCEEEDTAQEYEVKYLEEGWIRDKPVKIYRNHFVIN